MQRMFRRETKAMTHKLQNRKAEKMKNTDLKYNMQHEENPIGSIIQFVSCP